MRRRRDKMGEESWMTPRFFGLRNGGVDLLRWERLQINRFVAEDEEFMFWTHSTYLRASCFLLSISKYQDSLKT